MSIEDSLRSDYLKRVAAMKKIPAQGVWCGFNKHTWSVDVNYCEKCGISREEDYEKLVYVQQQEKYELEKQQALASAAIKKLYNPAENAQAYADAAGFPSKLAGPKLTAQNVLAAQAGVLEQVFTNQATKMPLLFMPPVYNKKKNSFE